MKDGRLDEGDEFRVVDSEGGVIGLDVGEEIVFDKVDRLGRVPGQGIGVVEEILGFQDVTILVLLFRPRRPRRWDGGAGGGRGSGRGSGNLRKLWIPDAMLGPDTGPEFPVWIPFPTPPAADALVLVCDLGVDPNLDASRVDVDASVPPRTERAEIPPFDAFLLDAHPEPEGLGQGRGGTLFEGLRRWEGPNVRKLEKAWMGLVERVPTEDAFVQKPAVVLDLFAQVGARGDKLALKPVLNVDAVEDAVGGEVPTGEEEGEEGLAGQTGIVCAPYHGGVVFGVRTGRDGILVVQQRRLRRRQRARVDAACEEGPIRRPGPAGKARPGVLVGVEVDVKAVRLAES